MPTYDGIEFDESAHTYTLKGRVYPSVTQVLKSAGMIDTSAPWYTDFHRTRGTFVHKACELLEKGELDESELDPQIVPYLDGWKAFLDSVKMEVIEIEMRFVDEFRGFSGTIDRVVQLSGRGTVLDIKNGPPAPWHAIQTAAYANGKPMGRGCVYLDGKGGFKLIMHKDANDWNVFLSALQVHHWKEKNAK